MRDELSALFPGLPFQPNLLGHHIAAPTLPWVWRKFSTEPQPEHPVHGALHFIPGHAPLSSGDYQESPAGQPSQLKTSAVERKLTAATRGAQQVAEAFETAHQHLFTGNMPAAESTLRHGIRGMSEFDRNTPSDFVFAVWNVLAVSALMKDDMDSVQTWLLQSERTLRSLQEQCETDRYQHVLGDLKSIRGVHQYRSGDAEAAGMSLQDAFQRHMTAGSTASAVLDLILKARLIMSLGDWNDATSLLGCAAQILGPTPESTSAASTTMRSSDTACATAASAAENSGTAVHLCLRNAIIDARHHIEVIQIRRRLAADN